MNIFKKIILQINFLSITLFLIFFCVLSWADSSLVFFMPQKIFCMDSSHPSSCRFYNPYFKINIRTDNLKRLDIYVFEYAIYGDGTVDYYYNGMGDEDSLTLSSQYYSIEPAIHYSNNAWQASSHDDGDCEFFVAHPDISKCPYTRAPFKKH
jgi:hypothetical protein